MLFTGNWENTRMPDCIKKIVLQFLVFAVIGGLMLSEIGATDIEPGDLFKFATLASSSYSHTADYNTVLEVVHALKISVTSVCIAYFDNTFRLFAFEAVLS